MTWKFCRVRNPKTLTDTGKFFLIRKISLHEMHALYCPAEVIHSWVNEMRSQFHPIEDLELFISVREGSLIMTMCPSERINK